VFGRVAAGLRAAGRKPKARAYDALVASIAISTGLPLYTVNPDDFAGIADLDLRPVPHPDRVCEH
jgi:predicted nucleic acid-binding protein